MKNYRKEIIIGVLMIGFSIAFYYLYGILLPFILGMLLAFSAQPIIKRIQKIVKSKGLATSIFLAVNTVLIILFFVFFTNYINRDFKRLNQSFVFLTTKNQENLNQTTQKVKEYINNLYDIDQVEVLLKHKSDSIINKIKNIDYSELDSESIKTGFEKATAIFQSKKINTEQLKPKFSFLFILCSTIGYFILILYQLDYFTRIRKKYFGGKIKSIFHTIIDDFNQSFVKYFKLKTKIILLLSLIYISTFIILDMPGTILISLLIILLSYISYLQYLALIPLSISCMVLSVENSQSFLFYFSIVIAVFIMASVIEEWLLKPRIMKDNTGINPVIIALALSIWTYLLGMPGGLIAIPMTGLMIIIFKQYFLKPYQEAIKD
ncbi:MAG: AI-2E family transporter [Flavobacteriaceae bacterium]|nr:AI-2E family transporter [Flavobacteriaceae bacterium]|tara:strand:+ start:2705 stop:3838 length:1134 start_codon:yes stop_codon:yes gene_type:complete